MTEPIHVWAFHVITEDGEITIYVREEMIIPWYKNHGTQGNPQDTRYFKYDFYPDRQSAWLENKDVRIYNTCSYSRRTVTSLKKTIKKMFQRRDRGKGIYPKNHHLKEKLLNFGYLEDIIFCSDYEG